MTTYCALTPIPTRAELSAIFAGPELSLKLPSLPTFPKPFFGSINDPETSIEHWIHDACQNAQMTMLAFLLDLLPPLPKFPVPPYNIDIMGALKMDYEAIKKGIIEFLKSLYPEWPLKGGSFFPVQIPEVDLAHTISNFMIEAGKMIIEKIQTLLQPFIDIAKLLTQGAFPSLTLPTIPTMDEITLLLKIPGDYLEFGWAKIPKPPYTKKKITMNDVNIPKWTAGVMGDLVSAVIKILTDYIKSLFDLIGGFIPPFPHLCVDTETGLFIHMGPWTLASSTDVTSGVQISPPTDLNDKIRPWTAGNSWQIGDVYSVKQGETYRYFRVNEAYTPRKFIIFPSLTYLTSGPAPYVGPPSATTPAPWDYTEDYIPAPIPVKQEFDGDAKFCTEVFPAKGTLILDSAGVITGVNITDGGSGYLSQPRIRLTGPGGSKKGTAIINNGVIKQIIVE